MLDQTSSTVSLSVVINTKNAEKTLQRALDSVPFASEIIVVDMQSSDGTCALAKKYTPHVYEHKDVGYADPARNFALSKARSEWILVLDADEWVPDTLATKIPQMIQDSEVDCFFLPRVNIIFDKEIKHTGWWPDYQPRLFKKGKVSWEVGVHKEPLVEGNTEHLPAQKKNALYHENYTSVSHFLQKLDVYTTVSAQEKFESADSHSSKDFIRSFFDEFFSRYFNSQGSKELEHGVALSLLQAMYQVTERIKIWELQKYASHDTELASIDELERATRGLRYWTTTWRINNSTGFKKMYWKVLRKFA